MPDIFDMFNLTRYGNSEVITPQNIVSDMVDLLPQEVFNPDTTFLDPAVKSGRFLKEIYTRLFKSDSLITAFPDENERREHILHNQLFGIALSATAATLSRFVLYKVADIRGNIIYDDNYIARISKRDETGIRTIIKGAFDIMQFDIVIGNPPYNNDLYLDFVSMGHRLSKQYTCMITPAKWQAKGGKKNEDFRQNIVPYMSKIVYYPDCSDVFQIADMGGISYFILCKNIGSRIEIEEKCKLNKLLNRHCVWDNWSNSKVLDLESNAIIEKVLAAKEEKYNIKRVDTTKYYKVFVATIQAIGGSKSLGTYIFSREGSLQYLAKPSIAKGINEARTFSHNYHIIYTSDDIDNINSAISYFYSKLIRFLLYSARCGNTNMTEENWRFVPDPGSFDHIFTDQELYQKYNLTPEEIAIIESVIKERN